MYCKRHENRGRIVFALCDKDLIGNVYRQGKIVLDLKNYAQFYIGADIMLLNRDFESINAVGKKSTDYLIKQGYTSRQNLRYVEGIPHVQIYNIK